MSPRVGHPVRERPAHPTLGQVLRRVTHGVLQDECMGSAAQIAYYMLFATFPFLLSLASLLAFLPVQGLMARLLRLIADVAPLQVVEFLRRNLEHLETHPRGGLLAIGVLVAVWAAANAVDAVGQGLNRVHRLREHRPFWKVRAIAIALAVGVSALTVLGLLVLWFGSQVSHWMAGPGGFGRGAVVTWDLARWPLVLVFLIVAVDHLYFFAPAVEQPWRWVTPGSILAVLGWTTASIGFSAYVRHFGSYNATYGGLGAVILLLTWMYLSAFFILLGAEVNAALLALAHEPAEREP